MTGLIAVKPRNEILFNCIQQIVENVKIRFYGRDSLDPTGPGLLGKYSTKEEKKEMKLYFANINIKNIIDDWIIVFNDIAILKQYNGYRAEQTKNIMAIYGEKEKFIYNIISSFNLLPIIVYLSFSKLLLRRLQGVQD